MSVDGLQLDKLMNISSTVQSLFSLDAVVVAIARRRISTSLVKEDTLNKALPTTPTAFLAQEFSSVCTFQNNHNKNDFKRNLLIDAVSALRFACL